MLEEFHQIGHSTTINWTSSGAAFKDITANGYRLQPEYFNSRRTTFFNIPIDLPRNVEAAYLSHFRDVEVVTLFHRKMSTKWWLLLHIMSAERVSLSSQILFPSVTFNSQWSWREDSLTAGTVNSWWHMARTCPKKAPQETVSVSKAPLSDLEQTKGNSTTISRGGSEVFKRGFDLFVWVLWHINHCRLFNAKSIFIQTVLFQAI